MSGGSWWGWWDWEGGRWDGNGWWEDSWWDGNGWWKDNWEDGWGDGKDDWWQESGWQDDWWQDDDGWWEKEGLSDSEKEGDGWEGEGGGWKEEGGAATKKKQRSGAQKYTARLKRMQWVQGQPTPGTEAYHIQRLGAMGESRFRRLQSRQAPTPPGPVQQPHTFWMPPGMGYDPTQYLPAEQIQPPFIMWQGQVLCAISCCSLHISLAR